MKTPQLASSTTGHSGSQVTDRSISPKPGKTSQVRAKRTARSAGGDHAHAEQDASVGRAERHRVDRVGVPGDRRGRRTAGARLQAGAPSRSAMQAALPPTYVRHQVDVGDDAPGAVGRPPHVRALLDGFRRQVRGGELDRARAPASTHVRRRRPGRAASASRAEAVPDAEPAVVGRRGVPAGARRPARSATDTGQVALGGGVVPQRRLVVVAQNSQRPVIEAHCISGVGGAAVGGGDLGPARPRRRRRSVRSGRRGGRRGRRPSNTGGQEPSDGADGAVAPATSGPAEVVRTGRPANCTAREPTQENGQPPGCSAALPSDGAAARGPTGQMSAARGSGDCPVLARRRTTDGRSCRRSDTQSERAAHLDGG